MGRNKNNNTERLSFVCSPKVRELLEELQERIQADSMAEVIRRALLVYANLLEADSVIVSKDGVQKEIVLL